MALEVLSIVITPVTEVGKYLVRKLKTEFDYVTKYNSHLSKFREELDQLQKKREDVDERVKKAERELKAPTKEVLGWVQRVKDLEEKCIRLTSNNSTDNKCRMGFLFSRRRACKKILKLTKATCDLKNNGSFTDIAHQLPSVAVVPMVSSGTVENIPSREHIMKEVMEALEDDNIWSIGVHGMGGIGKTTLVTSINNKLVESHSFKKVIMITVSKDPNMKIIQDRIAERFGLKLEEQDMATRAYKLCQRLRSEESVLIILDDVWKPMELGEIGLGHSIEHMSCKLIVTTRNADVCRGMDVKKVIKMAILPEDEAWALFEAKAGDVVEMPSLEPTAREIVRRCKGSPLSIATLGSTLRAEKEEPIWAHALQVLKEPNAMGLDDIMPEVVTSLKWSYDHLKRKPNVQLCFLYCCLFPEDYNIRLTELRNCGIGEGFLKMTSSLKEAQNELLRSVKILKDCCLLLDGDDHYESSVKMHDVVRDVAICIASNDEDGFLVNIGGGSKYLPESEKLHTYKRISYMKNNRDSVFPNALECPQLRSLLVHDSDLEETFSFEGVKSLLVLYMWGKWEWVSVSVPESISQLRNLRTLYLEGMNLVDKTYLLGGLTKLEVLSMRWSKIGELPVEFGNLINLRFLDLTDTRIEFVAPNVFSGFLKMEELLIADSIKGWDTTGELEDDHGYRRWRIREDGSRRYAELKEVLSLPRLSVLDIEIKRPLLDGEVLNYHNLQHFGISVDKRRWLYDLDSDMNQLSISSTDLGKHWIRNLIAISNKNLCLSLSSCGGFKSVTDLDPAGSFNHLQSLLLNSCNDVESVIVADRSSITAQDSFEKLESLELHNMDKMERILHGATSSTKFLGKLEAVSVNECSKISTIFPSNLLFTGLENLKVVGVHSCVEVQHIFNTEDNEFRATPATTALLSGVIFIKLYELPKLKGIWKGIMPEGSFQGLTKLYVGDCDSLQHLLPSDVAGLLQNLEEIIINNCDALETIINSIGEEAEETSLFPRCRILTIKSCPKLKNIFSLGVARHLHQLNSLSISHCHGLRFIFGNGEDPRITEHNYLLPGLKYLKLCDLKRLTRFNQDNLPISGPLEEIKVLVCPNLVRLPLQTVSALKLFHMEEIWFRRLESEDGSLVSMLQPFIIPFSQVNKDIPASVCRLIDGELDTFPWKVAEIWKDIPGPEVRLIDGELETLCWKVAGIWLDNYDSQLECATHLRKILSEMTCYATTENVVRSDVVPCLVEFLNREDHTQLQSEAAWVLAYIASGSSDHSKVVIDHGAVPIFVKLIDSPNKDIRKHAVWALGNVAADSSEYRDIVLGHGALVPLLAQLSDCNEVSIMRNALWTISNFFTVKPQLPFEQLKLALPYIFNLLTHHDASIKKDACRIISEITAGNKECIQLVIVANIIAPLVHLLETAEPNIKKEAARAISNAICHGTQKQINHLVEQGCIRRFCDLLRCFDSSIIVVCLQGLSNILKVGKTGDMGIMNRYVQIIDDYGGFQNIAYLQGHVNNEIQQKAADILKSFQLEKYTPSAGDARITSFQSGECKSNCVEKATISSTETENLVSKCKQVNKNGLDLKQKLSSFHKYFGMIEVNDPSCMLSFGNAKIDLNYPPSSPIEIANECLVAQMPDEEPYVRDIRNNAFVKIDDNTRQSSSTKLAMASHIIRTPEQDMRVIETWRNVSMKEGYLIGDSSNASVMYDYELDSIVWDNISTATTSAHDEVWNDQSIEDYGITGADDLLYMMSLSNAKIDLNYPPSSPIEIADERQVYQMPNEEPYVRDIRSNPSVKIDDDSSQSPSTKLAKQSNVIQTPKQVLHLMETSRNSSMKLDLNSLPTSSTEPEKESPASQMPEQEGYLIGNSNNASVKDNHKSNSTAWDSSPNEVMGESISTATTSVHDEVWHDHSKSHIGSRKYEDSTGLEQSKTITIQVAKSCTGQESSSDYTITESMKTLNDMDMNIGRITYI